MGCIYKPFDDEDVKCYINTKIIFLITTGVYNCIVTVMYMKLFVIIPTVFVFIFSFIETFFDKQFNNQLNADAQLLNNQHNSDQRPVILVNNLGDIEIGIPVQK